MYVMCVPDGVVGDVEVPGDGRVCVAVCVAVWRMGRVRWTAMETVLQGQGSTSTGGIPSQDLQRRVRIYGVVLV